MSENGTGGKSGERHRATKRNGRTEQRDGIQRDEKVCKTPSRKTGRVASEWRMESDRNDKNERANDDNNKNERANNNNDNNDKNERV